MANTTIELRQSGSTGNTPSLGVLANGELAINRADGILYYKSSGNTLGSIRTTQPAGLTTEIQFNDAGSFGSNSGFTFSKTTGAVSVSGNVSTAAYFLGDGSKLTGLAPALQIYSLANTASGVSDYMVLKSLDAYTVGTQNTTTKTVTTTPTILTSFVSDVGFPNITSVPSGDIVVEFDTQKSSGAIGYYCYAEIYKRAVGGTETLIATTGNSSSSTLNSQIQQRVNVYISTPVSLVVSDRIVVKIYAVMLSTSASISILFDGAADGALTLPVLPASTVNFVPYINATANVQLNSYSLVANTVTANSIIVLGRDLNAFANAAFDKANSVTQQGFVTVAANGTSVVADANNDTLTLTAAAANGIQILANATSDTIDFGLKPSGVTSGTYGNTSTAVTITIDQFGRITSVSQTAITYTETDPLALAYAIALG